MNVLNLLRPDPALEEIQDADVVKKRYRYWRLRIFYSMYIGYAFFYFTRKSLTAAMPLMMIHLGYDKAQLGILTSIWAVSYGASKFLSGVVSDKSNPRYFMGIGLILTGVCNILFGLSSSIVFFIVFWGLNGWFQGWGWPPCAKLLTHWYSQSERGRWWGVWNTSHNVGGALIPVIGGLVATYFGWRYALYIPGALTIVFGFFIINRLRDTPQSLGLPSVEKFRGEPAEESSYDEKKSALSTKEILFEYVLKNKFIWILSFSYFFIYIIRSALCDWLYIYLYEIKGLPYVKALWTVTFFEVGGFVGSLMAGWISDSVFQGRRGPVNVLYSIGVMASFFSIWYLPWGNLGLASLAMFFGGGFIFGPQMLIGMAAAELSHKNASGTATGFAGCFAYLGAATAGWPLGKIAETWGWDGFFTVLTACGIFSTALLLPLWSKRSKTSSESTEESTYEPVLDE